ncbi:hypothetical protein KGF56_004019 [Candida oxycetoniae]|uniref:AB hydrolase-1 domain-containing protein n=1 Tax=Candida oxycetoniae TaxID=497107 RepID=A0AAI9WWE3_9ASCO|nr:uncharacterized protein KGF56_004019 [Candida oxycetoniae]KAI3403130.2 hypothetical protein KGF56_004019 [Candida oxycetoniae]
MGDPNTQSFTNLSSSSLFSSFSQANETSVSTNSSINSIPLTKSFQDWWSSPTRLRQETKSNTKKDEILEQAKQRNRKIEFDLFRAVLPSKIYIKPLDEKEEEETGDSENTIWGQLMDVELEDGTVIHEFYLENNETGSVSEQHIVIIHGYMAALGYFIKNIESLVSIMGVRLHIIDLPGFGNSSRAKFPEEFLTEPRELKNKIYQILQIESWFIDKIESWRKIRRIDHFKLIGHSMGAYLSCCYLMKHNNQNGKKLVDDLILISPMGTESSEHSLINNKKFDINLHGTNDPFQELVIEEEDGKVVINEEFTKLLDTLGRPKFPKNYILQKLWQFNMSAFEVLQKLGPFYSKILSYWSFQRFKNFSESDDTHEV